MRVRPMPDTNVWDVMTRTSADTFRTEVIRPVECQMEIVDGISARIRVGVVIEDGAPVLLLAHNGHDLRRREWGPGGVTARLQDAEAALSRERFDRAADADRRRREAQAREYATGWVERMVDPWA